MSTELDKSIEAGKRRIRDLHRHQAECDEEAKLLGVEGFTMIDNHPAEREYLHEQPLPENVVPLEVVTSNDCDPVNILRGAFDADLEELIVVGMKKDGTEYFASTVGDAAPVIYHLMRAVHKLNCIIDEGTKGEDNFGRKA